MERTVVWLSAAGNRSHCFHGAGRMERRRQTGAPEGGTVPVKMRLQKIRDRCRIHRCTGNRWCRNAVGSAHSEAGMTAKRQHRR
jgi:hypothetical protein